MFSRSGLPQLSELAEAGPDSKTALFMGEEAGVPYVSAAADDAPLPIGEETGLPQDSELLSMEDEPLLTLIGEDSGVPQESDLAEDAEPLLIGEEEGVPQESEFPGDDESAGPEYELPAEPDEPRELDPLLMGEEAGVP